MDAIARELKVRRRVSAIFNKQEPDFASKEAWDDYLEELEDVVYNLANNVDVQQTEQRLAEYERANRASIISNRAKQASEARAAHVAAHVQSVVVSRGDDASAKDAAAAPAPAAAAAASAVPASFAPTLQGAPLLAVQPLPLRAAHMDRNGTLLPPPGKRPPPLTDQDPAALAAGWSPDLPQARALEEAFAGLLVFTPAASQQQQQQQQQQRVAVEGGKGT